MKTVFRPNAGLGRDTSREPVAWTHRWSGLDLPSQGSHFLVADALARGTGAGILRGGI